MLYCEYMHTYFLLRIYVITVSFRYHVANILVTFPIFHLTLSIRERIINCILLLNLSNVTY